MMAPDDGEHKEDTPAQRWERTMGEMMLDYQRSRQLGTAVIAAEQHLRRVRTLPHPARLTLDCMFITTLADTVVGVLTTTMPLLHSNTERARVTRLITALNEETQFILTSATQGFLNPDTQTGHHAMQQAHTEFKQASGAAPAADASCTDAHALV